MELLSNINKNSFFFFSWLMRWCRLSSFPVHAGRQLPGTGVVVVLRRRRDVGVGVHGEADFLQVPRGRGGVWGDSFGLLLLPGHFLVDRGHGLPAEVFPHLQLAGHKQSDFYADFGV